MNIKVFFFQLDNLLRLVTGKADLRFGGKTVLLCGDPKQMPPVPEPWWLDYGEHCFTSTVWPLHHFCLTESRRYTDKELEKGIVQFISRLSATNLPKYFWFKMLI